jgi:N-acyl-D-amino-acid deacylase
MLEDSRWDVLIRNAEIYDGSGDPPFRADIALRGERIARIGHLPGNGGVTIDATGMALAPGFIDVHSHDDVAVFLHPEMAFKVMQGVTTELVGNCGLGPAPFPAAAQMFRTFHARAEWPEWKGHKGYLQALAEAPASLNVAVLVGHGTIRLETMGTERRPPGQRDLAAMQRTVNEGLDAGAFGLSTGLIYEPGRYAEPDEICALAKEAATAGGLYATHMRNEAAGLLDSISETLHVGEAAGIPVQVSHHKAAGRENWGLIRDSLCLLEKARARGLDATADQYPYTAASTALIAVLQNDAFNERGRDGGLGRVNPEDVLIASAPKHPEYEGKTLRDLCETFGLEPEAAARRVVDEEGLSALAVVEVMDEQDVRTVMRHPSTMIGSDGIPAIDGKPHPRLYGTFPRVLGRYARDQQILSMAEAVHRMTGFPATKFRIAERGFVREGLFADLVIFDPRTIRDTATFHDPHRFPAGIVHVFVNGVAVVRDGRHTAERPGKGLRRS